MRFDAAAERRAACSCATHFRPEFLNRIDEIIVFQPLDEAQLKRDRRPAAGRRRAAAGRVAASAWS